VRVRKDIETAYPNRKDLKSVQSNTRTLASVQSDTLFARDGGLSGDPIFLVAT
jgi:hypothetical protein